MDENNFSRISNADSLEKMGEFWDTHDFTDFDNSDAPDVEFTVAYAVPVELLKTLLQRDIEFVVTGFNGKDNLEKMVARKDFHPLLFSTIMEDYMRVLLLAVDELAKENSVTTRMKV